MLHPPQETNSQNDDWIKEQEWTIKELLHEQLLSYSLAKFANIWKVLSEC